MNLTPEEKRLRKNAAQKRYRKTHKEAVTAYNEKWKAENHEYYREHQRLYLREWRARRRMDEHRPANRGA